MEDKGDLQISRTLGYEIRKYKEAELNKPVLLLSICDVVEGELRIKGTLDQAIAFTAYDDNNIDSLGYIVPRDLAVCGIMVFQKHQFSKLEGIIDRIQNCQGEGSPRVIKDFEANCFYYDEEEDEFFSLKQKTAGGFTKKEEIEVAEGDSFLDYFILSGSFKFLKSGRSTLQEQIKRALQHGGFLQINELDGDILLLSNLDDSNFMIKLGSLSFSKDSVNNLASFIKDYRKYNVDDTSPTPVSQLPKHYCKILLSFEDDLIETNFTEIGQDNISYDYLDFMTIVHINEPAQNLEGVIRRLLCDLNLRLRSEYRVLVNYENGSCPFYISNFLKQKEFENGFSYSDKRVFFMDARIASEQRSTQHQEKLRNVHLGIMSKVQGGDVRTVRGDYIYFHYNQDGFKDEGWGCAYRSLQTLYSWFLLQGFTSRDVPSIPEIQETLFKIGDKPAKFMGSKDWIGSLEVSYVLQKLAKVDSKIITLSSGAEILSKAYEFKSHFETFGTPIMIGGGVLAFTMLGIAINEDKLEETKFLILDPHYKGKRNWKTITDQKKGGVYWKTSKMFHAKHFYNFCCPIPSSY